MRDNPFPGAPDDMMNTIAALRARMAKLEAVLLENYDQINALRAYVAKLEAALQSRNARSVSFPEFMPMGTIPRNRPKISIDAALKDAPQ